MQDFYNSKLSRYVILLIYPAVILVQAAKMFGLQLNMLLHMPLLLFIVLLGFNKIRWFNKYSKKAIDIFFIYLVYVVISVFWYLFNNLPINAYVSSITTYILPMTFYLWGVDSRDTSDQFYRFFLISVLVSIIVGLILYLYAPPFYVSYMLEVKQNGVMSSEWATEETILNSKRFSAIFVSSYTVSYLGMSALLILFSSVLNKREILTNKYIIIVVSIILVISVILCMQRIAMAMVIAFLLLFLFWGWKYKVRALRYIGSIILIAILLGATYGLVLFDRGDQLLSMLTQRLEAMNFKEAMAGRINQFESINFLSIDKIFGNGCGAGIYMGVTDAEYPKQIIDFGYVGLFLFMCLIINSVSRIKRKFKVFSMELCIVFYYLVAGIGHDSITTYYTCYIFWFALGRLNNTAYRCRLISENSLLCQR